MFFLTDFKKYVSCNFKGNHSTKGKKNKQAKNSSKKSKGSKLNGSKALSSLSKSFRKETLLDVIHTSLLWESIEQMFFWELVIATDTIDVDYLLPVFARLDSTRHAEATSVLFQLLKTSDPTLDIVTHVIQRRVDDPVARALFIHWTHTSGETKMTQIVTKLLNKAALQQQQMQSQQPSTTAKKIKYNESLSNSAKKLTAEQQLEMMNASNNKSGNKQFWVF